MVNQYANIRIGTIDIEADEVADVDRIAGYEEFKSYKGTYALPINDIYNELTFKAEFNKDSKDRTTFLDACNGNSYIIASTMFKSFRGRVFAKKRSIPSASEYTVYEITIKEFEN
jgi:hypothetical protein